MRLGPTRRPTIARPALVLLLLVATLETVPAAGRKWQSGTWGESGTTRQMIDFGPGGSGFGPPRSNPSMRAMADVHTYVIETDTLRLELRDVVPVGRPSIDAPIGSSVTFALEKNTVYVKDAAGVERKLRVAKKTVKLPSP
jgi:hypothetical protein